MKTFKRKIGDQGEKVASRFLKRRGFKILKRNFLIKAGEIDIIAIKNNVIHFIEVKTVSRITQNSVSRETKSDVIRETTDIFRPEDNVSSFKIQKIRRAIEVFISQNRSLKFDNYQLDVISVILETGKKPKIEDIENVS